MYVKCGECGGSGTVRVLIIESGNRYFIRRSCPHCKRGYIWQYEGVEE